VWRRKFPNVTAQYKGEDLPSKEIGINKAKSFRISAGRSSSWGSLLAVSPEHKSEFLFVTGFTNSDLKASPTMRKKAEIHLNNAGIKTGWGGFQYMVLMQEDTLASDPDQEKYLKDYLKVTWEELNKIRVPRIATSGAVRTDPYDILLDNGGYKQVSAFDTTKPIVYYSSAELKRPRWILTAIPDAQVVELPKNRWDKFKRDWPSAQHYHAAALAETKKVADALTLEDRIYHHYSGKLYYIPQVDIAKLDDPELVDFLTIIQGKASDRLQKWNSFPGTYPRPEIPKPTNPLTKYPLGDSLRYIDKDHAHWYLNNYYAEIKKGN
jgi:hypothetical protein